MPIYSYHCPDCDGHFDQQRPVIERHHTLRCPYCGQQHSERVLTPAAFVVKGFSAANGYTKKADG